MRNPEYEERLRGKLPLSAMEIEELNMLKDKIYSKTGKKEELKKEFKRKADYLNAGIPPLYWDIDWEDFRGDKVSFDFVRKYIENIEKALEAGQGIIFSGSHGTGKTTLACLILKEAIKRGYTARYISAAKIIDMIMENFNHKGRNRLDILIERVEFMVLDDLGKEYKGVRGQLNPMVSLKLDSLLRERVNRSLVTISTTNYTLKAIQREYGDSVLSVLGGTSKGIDVKGLDYRIRKRKDFWKELDD